MVSSQVPRCFEIFDLDLEFFGSALALFHRKGELKGKLFCPPYTHVVPNGPHLILISFFTLFCPNLMIDLSGSLIACMLVSTGGTFSAD